MKTSEIESAITFDILYPKNVNMKLLEHIADKLDEVFKLECWGLGLGKLDHTVSVSVG